MGTDPWEIVRVRWMAVASLPCWPTTANAAPPEPTKIIVNGVELHYISVGTGEPLILLHGGQGDYRSWEPQIAALSRYYHVISYSRRYNFPNQNPQTATNHSVLVEAADLAALIKALKLKHVNLVGTSMGAATALTLAVEYPKLVRSLVLAEPPLLAWARRFPEGSALYDDFMSASRTRRAKPSRRAMTRRPCDFSWMALRSPDASTASRQKRGRASCRTRAFSR